MAVERPISTVLHDIMGNVQEIVRSEVRLAKTELTEEAGKASSASMLIGAGVIMIAISMAFALWAVFYALSLVMPEWAAALIIAVVEGASAALFVSLGIKRFKRVRAAPKTTATLKENVEWVKQATK